MNLAHVHLLLNHFPTVGFGVGLGLFLVALFGKSGDLKRASLAVFVVIALLALPTYLSGNAAQQAIEGRPEVSEALIKTHENAALPAFVFMEITGALAWLGLWQFRQTARPARWNLSAVLILSILTFGLMARAAIIGGEIRHPEIQATTATEETLQSASIVASFVTGHPWVWPASETFHFMGLCLLFGVVVLVNLRMLGILKNVSSVALHRLLPWGILGLGINVATGMLFFIANPGQYTQNVAFFWKIIFLVLAGANVLYMTVFDDDDGPLPAKVVASASIFLWIAVIFFGRMLPYIGSE